MRKPPLINVFNLITKRPVVNGSGENLPIENR